MGLKLDEAKESASDLKGFASREWLAGLLNPATVASPHYFGGTKFKDSPMVSFVQGDVKGYSPAQAAQLTKVLAALSAEAGLTAQKSADQRDAAVIAEGRQLIQKEISCTECHQFRAPNPDATAPDLTGYGSTEWLTAFLNDPAHARFYGAQNDRMPAFGKQGRLNEHDLNMLARWLRGDWDGAEAKP